MLRKPHFILLASAALLVLVILAMPEHARSRLRMAAASFFLPLFGLASSTQGAVEKLAGALTPRSTLGARIASLEKENERLLLLLAEARSAAQESERLRLMLGYRRPTAWKLEPARVIGRDPANWWRSVHIDVGLRQGVTNNLAVLAPEGLVGRVAEAGAWTSRVVLLGDPNCPVAAALAETRETGILLGASDGDIQGGLVDLSFLPRSAVVKPGQRVVTSGQGGVFPPGILIGEVVDTRAVGEGVYMEARVRTAVLLGALDHVWVKLP